MVQGITKWTKTENKYPKLRGGVVGEGGRSNLGCRDILLKTVSLLKNYRSEGGKVYIFGKLSALAF